MSAFPTVSVVVPALDEVGGIGSVVRGFLDCSDPAVLEVLVVDGGSSDGTRDVVRALAEEDSRVRLLDNAQRVQAAGLNIGLEHARGDVFLRADGHCEYAGDYVACCLRALHETSARSVGGRQRFIARNAFQAGSALAASSLLGSGGARYRTPGYEGWADTVFLGCFHVTDLRALGGFLPAAHPAEDAELHLRLAALSGGECSGIWVGPDIRVWYHPRSTWRSFAIQTFHHGRGRACTVRLHPGRTSLRGRLPVGIAAGTVLCPLFELGVHGSLVWSAAAALLGGLFLLAYGLVVAWSGRGHFDRDIWRGSPEQRPWLVSRAVLCALVIGIQPIFHGLGFAWQWTRDAFLPGKLGERWQGASALPESGEVDEEGLDR